MGWVSIWGCSDILSRGGLRILLHRHPFSSSHHRHLLLLYIHLRLRLLLSPFNRLKWNLTSKTLTSYSCLSITASNEFATHESKFGSLDLRIDEKPDKCPVPKISSYRRSFEVIVFAKYALENYQSNECKREKHQTGMELELEDIAVLREEEAPPLKSEIKVGSEMHIVALVKLN
ncbi:hypothetical protein L2E82_24904 [Cichorium intybus]|uniref:Uncharacterized protein n=1 Tax=Cichorium intybus TaxID=13427 RepID=A0ACB9E1Z7_CICIN|nr:hypothetical protein L2E82_24904 [Cichorium intybus]